MQTGPGLKALIVGVQEPPTSHGSIKSLSKEHTLIYDHSIMQVGREQPSTHPGISTCGPSVSTQNGDVATCLWKTGNSQLPELVISSIYLDITNTQVCPDMK